MIKEATEQISRNKNLSATQMEAVMEEMMTGRAQTPEIIDFLSALNKKGQTPEELTAAVSVMRRHVTRINIDAPVILDTCGTGGDKKGTFNISTAVALVASGCGIIVAKHGNRSVSSKSGSADILEALGVNINLSKEKIEGCLKEIGIAFLFAPALHPAMKYAMPARKQMAKRTLFNILGPLTNPAGATHQLIGVFNRHLIETLPRVLANLGTVHALLVHGEDGLDEVTTTGKTFISEVKKEEIKNYTLCPEDFKIKRAKLSDLKGGTAQENARMLLGILEGEQGPLRDIVVLNAAAAIYTADKTDSIKEGIKLAEESIDSGKALEKLDLLKKFSHE